MIHGEEEEEMEVTKVLEEQLANQNRRTTKIKKFHRTTYMIEVRYCRPSGVQAS